MAGVAGDSAIGRNRGRAAAVVSIGLEEARTMGNWSKMQMVYCEAEDLRKIHKFAETGALLNIFRSLDSSLRLSASGIRHWGVFCDLKVQQQSPLRSRRC